MTAEDSSGLDGILEGAVEIESKERKSENEDKARKVTRAEEKNPTMWKPIAICENNFL